MDLMSSPAPQTFYEAVGGHDFILALYPEADLGPAEERFRMFLEQYWGGPTTYSDGRGHPRLRMRHAPFEVTPEQRDRWLTHMRDAIDAMAMDPELERVLWTYLERTAQSMVNSFGPEPARSLL